jgi:hypothetical protein
VGRLRREGRGAATQGHSGRHRGRGGGHSARMHVHLSVLWRDTGDGRPGNRRR